MSEKEPKLDLQELPIATQEQINAAVDDSDAEMPNLVEEGDGEQGRVVEKSVAPVMSRIHLGKKKGFKKADLLGFLPQVQNVVLSEALNAYEQAGRPVLTENQPLGVSMETELSFMLGTLDDLVKLPLVNGHALMQVQKRGDLPEGKWGPLFEADGKQPIWNTPEDTLRIAVEGAFEQLAENITEGLLPTLDDARSYKAFIQVAYLWDKKPDAVLVN